MGQTQGQECDLLEWCTKPEHIVNIERKIEKRDEDKHHAICRERRYGEEK